MKKKLMVTGMMVMMVLTAAGCKKNRNASAVGK